MGGGRNRVKVCLLPTLPAQTPPRAHVRATSHIRRAILTRVYRRARGRSAARAQPPAKARRRPRTSATTQPRQITRQLPRPLSSPIDARDTVEARARPSPQCPPAIDTPTPGAAHAHLIPAARDDEMKSLRRWAGPLNGQHLPSLRADRPASCGMGSPPGRRRWGQTRRMREAGPGRGLPAG